jgi:hypothetical protein
VAATPDDFCAICVIDDKLTPSIEWPGGPICRQCLAEAISNRASLPKCPLSDLQACVPPAPRPSPGLVNTTLQ